MICQYAEIISAIFRVTFSRRRSHSPVVRGSACLARYCAPSGGTPCVKRSVVAAARKLCADRRDGSPAAFGRRLAGSQKYKNNNTFEYKNNIDIKLLLRKRNHAATPIADRAIPCVLASDRLPAPDNPAIV